MAPAAVGDEDRLDAGEAPGGEQAVAGREEGRQLLLADRLEHLDRGDLREAALDRPVVLLQDLGSAGQAGRGDPLSGELRLRRRDGHSGHPRAVFAGGDEREAAPAAADLEDVVARAEAKLVADPAELPQLCLLQGVALLLEDRAGVRHRLVEKEAEELVAEVVVVLDVAACEQRVLPVVQARARLGEALQPRMARRGGFGVAE